MLTFSYPFGKGEQFLKNELDVLSEGNFDIGIYSHYQNGKKRDIPTNINSFTRPRLLFLILGILYAMLRYARYYLDDIIKTIKSEKLNFFRASRFIYIINYLIRSASFIAWFDIFYKKDHTERLIIYSYWMNSESYAVSILKRANPSLKTVSRVHGGDLYVERNSNFLPFRKQIIQSLEKIFPISDHGKEYLIKNYKYLDEQKLIVSRLGVNMQKRLLNTLQDNKIIIASCSSDDPVKRVDSIISALGHYSNTTNKKVIWLSIGIDKELFFKKYENSIKVFPNLYCEALGIMSNNDVCLSYKKYQPNIFINLSSTEGVPVAIMEALSFGIPVLATNVGGTSEIVNNSVGSLISHDINNGTIAKELDRLLDSLEDYSKEAYKQWSKLCDKSYNYNKFMQNLYKIHND